MKTRVVVGAVVFLLCVGVSAGCGGSSLTAIAYKQAKNYGVPQPVLARSETVRIEGGSRWRMIWMKGRSAFRSGCPRSQIGLPEGPGVQPCRARYLILGVRLSTHTMPGLGWALSSSQVAAIKRERRASDRFRIFPDFMGIGVRCAIPRGNLPGGTLHGLCSTIAASVNHVRRVEFIEGWDSMSSGWVVTLSRDGRVQSIRVTGQPPQLWK
jgi:hypothetical protein